MDHKLETFLTLCRLMNYRMTAEELHLTQPAVTKQIQTLEQYYDTRLFIYNGRTLEKTESCLLLENYCRSLQYNYEEITRKLKEKKDKLIRIGTTKTIGDYVLLPQLTRFLKAEGNNCSLIVDNTETLLKMLDDAQLDFAVVEGFYNKNRYASKLLRKEPFVGICSANHPFANRTVKPEELFSENLILREHGSGTRDILEHECETIGYELSSFHKETVISSFKLIKGLVAEGVGITFAYQAILNGEPELSTFQVEGFHKEHEFNIVCLAGAISHGYADKFFL